MENVHLNDANILIGISGGIACYKVAAVVSHLSQAGANVRVIMTPSATKFVAPLTFQSLSGKAVLSDMWSHQDHPESQHIGLARWADLFCIAPCSADMIGKICSSLTPDMVSLTASALPTSTPFLLAPAMNADMWQHPMLQRNLTELKAHMTNLELIGPTSGWQACRTKGDGRMSEAADILQAITSHLKKS